MPPKKTPSKEPATVDPQIRQVLEMLQTLSAQMERLGKRIGAVEKESEAAREAGESIEEVDNVESAKKSVMRSKQKLREARRKVKVEAKDVFDEPSVGGAN